jgi:hypothetical protein
MLHLEREICDRLQGIPGVSGVYGMSALTPDGVGDKRLPAIFVTYDGYRVADAKSPGAVLLAVRWLAVLAVRNVADVTSGAPARAEAADIATRIVARLYRWKGNGALALQPLDAPRPIYEDGLLLITIPFEAQTIIDKE